MTNQLPSKADLPEEKLLNHTVLHAGPSYQFCVDQVTLPNGKTGTREYIKHPGAVAILAVDDQQRCVLVRQYRYPVGCVCTSLPAGKLDKLPNEQPLAAAKRELREETGVLAHEWTDLGFVHPAPGLSSEKLYLFFAKGLEFVEDDQDDDEFIQTVWMPVESLYQRLADGDITDAPVAFALACCKKRNLI